MKATNLAAQMALHPNFPVSPNAPLIPEQRWFPSDETLRVEALKKGMEEKSREFTEKDSELYAKA